MRENIYGRPKTCAVIAAAGNSSRMGLADGLSKQFIEIQGKTVIEKTVTAFALSSCIDEIIIAARPGDAAQIRQIVKFANLGKVKSIVEGGKTRQESVARAICEVGGDISYIAIHDGARCFVSEADIEKVVLKAFETGAAAAGTKITDTVKSVVGENIAGTLDREFLWAVQTPQVFSKDIYLSAMENPKNDFTDDCALLEAMGHRVSIVECSRYNIKITDMQDLDFINAKRETQKIGHGYDVHRLGENRKLILGGVEIPNEGIGLLGHSDADVLTHSIIDALIGAAGLGDIGEHFPDSDLKYKNISSVFLLGKIAELIQREYTISNIDCTVILEKPKLAGYKEDIRQKLSEILQIAKSDINIKAKTEEGLGFTGSGEGVGAHAVCLLVKK
ncbi:MAG: 2-C-methyl-D-erythritol 2,4-cyclodiphosphate synthase [Oscillospiraceae bacterium]|nr:2-C-methyl-D-erythritol 2,4-cyclodiphosphate synthase [Oscillospiraceae bacterium]